MNSDSAVPLPPDTRLAFVSPGSWRQPHPFSQTRAVPVSLRGNLAGAFGLRLFS